MSAEAKARHEENLLQEIKADGPPKPHDTSLVDQSQFDGFTEQETHKWLEREEEKAFKYILAVRALRNQNAPINRLPAEILSAIFLWASRSASTIYTTHSRITVTHVCRWWREVALRCGLLWADIHAASVDRLQVYLRRSKGALVHITLTCGSGRFDGEIEKLVQTLSPHSYRISSLILELVDGKMESLLPLMTFPLPNVQVLNLSSDIVLSSVTFTPNFDNRPSSVRVLILTNVFIPWESAIYRNLRKLVLVQQHGNASPNPSIDRFLNILQECPDLEVLTLSASGPTLIGGTIQTYSEPHCTVELLHITNVTLAFIPAPSVAYILAHLTIPPAATIVIQCPKLNSHTDVNGVLDVLPRNSSGIKTLNIITSLSMSSDSGSYAIHINAESSNSNWPDSPRIMVKLDWGSIFDEETFSLKTAETFHSLATAFESSPIRALYFGGDTSNIFTEHWMYFLSKFPMLEFISFCSQSSSYNIVDLEEIPGERIFRALQSQPLLPTLDCDFLCPKLTHLVMQDVVLGVNWGVTLKDCLRSRAERGAPRLRKLVILGPNHIGQGINMPSLSEYVEQFEYK